MNVNIDEAIIFLLRENLILKSKIDALESAVLVLSNQHKENSSSVVSELLKERQEELFQTYLLNHPFLKDDWDSVVEGFR